MIGTTTLFREELEKIVAAKLVRRRHQPGLVGHQYGHTWMSSSSEDEEDDAEDDDPLTRGAVDPDGVDDADSAVA